MSRTPTYVDGESSYRVLLRYPGLLRWVMARLLSGTAVSLVQAAVLWQMWTLTRSTALLGLLGVLQFIPVPFMSLAGGAAADRYNRKQLVVAAQITSFCTVLALMAASTSSSPPIGVLLVLVVLFSCTTSFEAPARSATLSSFVQDRDLPRAVATFVTAQSIAFMTGPALAGVIIARFDAKSALMTGAALLFFSVLMVHVAKVFSEREVAAPTTSLGRAIREGVRFVRGDTVLLGAMTADMVAVIFGGAAALLPTYATDILAVGPRGYGALASALEFGGLVAAALLLWMPPIQRLGKALVISILVFGVATVAFGLSRSFPLSLFAYAVAGAADQISMVVRGTLVQTRVPDGLRGRVSAVNMIFIGASNKLGAAESGFVAALTSPQFSVVSGGVACILFTILLMWLHPTLLRYRADR